MTTPESEPAGVCIVRVEPHEHYVLFQLRTTYFPFEPRRIVRTGESMHAADVDEVLAAVAKFLEPYRRMRRDAVR